MDYAALKQKLDDETIEFVDLRAADFVGRLRHVTLPASRFTEDLVRRGVGFDASNYGYCDVAGSDRVLIPDLETAYFEEHDGERILVLIASIYDAGTGEPAPCDPRRIASASALARTPPISTRETSNGPPRATSTRPSPP
jgi:glutamine synthetase